MKIQALEALKVSYTQQRDTLIQDAARCEALLRDACPDCRKEISVLVSVVKSGAAQEIASASESTPFASLRNRLIQRIEDEQGLSHEAATWGVDGWYEVVNRRPAPQNNRQQTPKVLPLAPAEDIVRDWKTGKETKNTYQVEAYVLSRKESDEEPGTIMDALTGHGIPQNIAEQILLKLSPRNDWTTILGGIALLVMWLVGSVTDAGWYTVFCLIGGITTLVMGMVQRRKWRKWTVSLAMRNADARRSKP